MLGTVVGAGNGASVFELAYKNSFCGNRMNTIQVKTSTRLSVTYEYVQITPRNHLGVSLSRWLPPFLPVSIRVASELRTRVVCTFPT